MSLKNFEHVSHKKSMNSKTINSEEYYGLTPTIDNSDAEGSSPIKVKIPKLPTADIINYGEIAVNYLSGHETLSIKNSKNKIVGFVNENEFSQAQEIVSDTLGQEKNERIKDISKLEEKITNLDNIAEDINNGIDNLELAVSSSLNDLNSRINAINDSGNEKFEEITTTIENLSNNIDEKFNTFDSNVENLELAVSSSLNDLNSRIKDLSDYSDASFENINSVIDSVNQRIDEEAEKFNNGIENLELAVSSSLNDLNSRITDLSNDSEAQVEETNAKFDSVNQRIDEETEKFNNGIENLELAVSSSLNDLNTRIIKHNNETYTKQEVNDLSSNFIDEVKYDSDNKQIIFKNGTNVISAIDATDFIKDGMVSRVEISEGNLVITFNTDAGKEPITIALTDIFNPTNYYDKTTADNTFATKTAMTEETEARTSAVNTINSTLETKANDSEVVHNSGSEDIHGHKTFIDHVYIDFYDLHNTNNDDKDLGSYLNEKANVSDVYTQSEINNKLEEINNQLDETEHTVSASLNDLNTRIEDLSDNSEIDFARIDENLQTLNTDNELNKTNLNNLNTEVSTLSNDVRVIKNYSYFDNELGIPVWWNGSKYVDNNGFTAALKKGPSSSRPTLTSDDEGYVYYDTDMNVNIIWDGEKWTQGGIPKDSPNSATRFGTFPNVEFEPYMDSGSGITGVLFCNLRSTQVPFEIGYCYTNNTLYPLPSLYDNKTNFGQPYASQYEEGYVVYRGDSTLEASATNPIFIRCYFHYTAPVSDKYVLFSDVYKYDGTTFEKYTQS